jgi:hypothetical protein
MPGWITGGKRSPYRLLMPIWISVETRAVFRGDVMRPEEYDPAGALDALAEAALLSPRGGYRPGRLEVTDPSPAEYLRDEVSELGIEVSRVDRLEQVQKFLKAIGEKVAGPMAMYAPLDAPGVTVERMSAFAEAAADFYRARLWNHLTLIRHFSKAVRYVSPLVICPADPDESFLLARSTVSSASFKLSTAASFVYTVAGIPSGRPLG